MPFGFCDRKTMDKIGNWDSTLNLAEDVEFVARAVSKGVKVFNIPSLLGFNEISSLKHREKRYTKNLIKYVVRRYKNLDDWIKVNAIKNYQELGSFYSGLRYLVAALVLFKIRVLGQYKLYNYSQGSSNIGFVDRNVTLLNPKSFNIPRTLYFYQILIRKDTVINLNKNLELLIKFGFDKVKFSDTKRMKVSIYTKELLASKSKISVLMGKPSH